MPIPIPKEWRQPVVKVLESAHPRKIEWTNPARVRWENDTLGAWITDTETGEEILTPESLERIEQVKARRMGLVSSDELKSLRERPDLTQEEISDLLQMGAKTCFALLRTASQLKKGHLRS